MPVKRESSKFVETVAISGRDSSEAVAAEFVTGNYFSVLRVVPVLGRTFTNEEDQGSVAVISDRFWRQHFANDPSAIGQVVRVNNVPFTVVGVAPPGFRGVGFPGVTVDVWLPLFSQGITRPPGSRQAQPSMGLMGRLNSGSSLAGLHTELESLQVPDGRRCKHPT